ncbi:hypothetical protein D1BOALGB6SA_2772 [Olavius sp. associated proteobacterium Delta 1]|nr:hypothetical protein D1BOALGB6SA_2772 [Olavius sp. associated proteobacterium Delta 1]
MQVRALLWNRLVHPSAKLPINFFQFRLPLLADRFTQYRKSPLPGLVTYVRKTQKIERLRFVLSLF